MSWRDFWQRGTDALIALVLLLAFWQWRHTFVFGQLGGVYFEWGSVHLYAVDAAAILLVAVATAARRVKLRSVTVSPLWWPSLVVLVWLTASGFWSANVWVSLATVGQWWLWAMVAVVLVQSRWPLSWALKWLLAGGLVTAAVGLVQFFVNHSLGLRLIGESVLDPGERGVPVVVSNGVRQLRAHGLQPHANIFGGIVAWVTAMWTWMSSGIRGGYAGVFIGLVLGSALVASFARGAWLITIALLAIALLVLALRKTRWFVAAWLIGAVSVAVWQGGAVMSRVVPEPTNALEARSVQERLDGVAQWAQMMDGHWLVGYGWGGYSLALADRYPEAHGYEINPVHNAALLIIAQLGVVGVALLAWWCVVLVGQVYRQRRWAQAMPLLVWVLLGVVDHWTVSLHQGVVALFLALALIFWPQEI